MNPIEIAASLLAGVVLAALLHVRRVGEPWWAATAVRYMPRALFLVPLAAVAGFGARSASPAAWIVMASTFLVIVGPLMGLSWPLHRRPAVAPTARTGPDSGVTLRIMTLNRGAGGLVPDRLIALLERERIDVVCLQEGGGDPVLRRYWQRGWHRSDFVASRFPILERSSPMEDEPAPEPPWRTRLEWVRLRAPDGTGFAVASLHLDTVRRGLGFALRGDFRRFRRHSEWRRGGPSRVLDALGRLPDLPLLLGGDFNMPADGPSFAPFLDRFRDCFAQAGRGYGYTYPAWLPWVRIDHLLAGPGWVVRRCWVGPRLGSDHRPMIAEVSLPAGRPAAPAR